VRKFNKDKMLKQKVRPKPQWTGKGSRYKSQDSQYIDYVKRMTPKIKFDFKVDSGRTGDGSPGKPIFRVGKSSPEGQEGKGQRRSPRTYD
jgi:hypothetical protein